MEGSEVVHRMCVHGGVSPGHTHTQQNTQRNNSSSVSIIHSVSQGCGGRLLGRKVKSVRSYYVKAGKGEVWREVR